MARIRSNQPEAEIASSRGDGESYKVVARRYRPQRFEDVVGQDHVVNALKNAIRLNRVTHAYLFSGTRGVGKTSLARIFAKALNCVKGPTESPCGECDICQSIAVGQDVDVIEIDGASNNGVEAVRELRQNAGLRPSRAKFKIYYIDEVHMLSTGAFNALLKTLEEPPEHVKFFFATTEANKIPITVLSRCQRYDLAGIAPEQITATLSEICRKEKVDVDPDALAIVARRANGSMRDSQSLLEQLLAASSGERLSVEAVHGLLGTATDERMLDLLDALSNKDPRSALTLLNQAVDSGVQPTDLLNGSLEFLRDAMVLSVGASGPLLATIPKQVPRLNQILERWSTDSILAALQILAEARSRLRGSPHGRIIVEMALVRVARLEDLSDLSSLITRLAALETGAPPIEKKKSPDAVAAEAKSLASFPKQPSSAEIHEQIGEKPAHPTELDLGDVLINWEGLCAKLGVVLGSKFNLIRPDKQIGPSLLRVPISPRHQSVAQLYADNATKQKIEAASRELFGHAFGLQFLEVAEAPVAEPKPKTSGGPWQEDPMVKDMVKLFDVKMIRVERTGVE